MRIYLSYLPELVAVCVLLIHIHEVVQCDEVGLVVDVEDTGLDVIDVIAVVIDILGRSFSAALFFRIHHRQAS